MNGKTVKTNPTALLSKEELGRILDEATQDNVNLLLFTAVSGLTRVLDQQSQLLRDVLPQRRVQPSSDWAPLVAKIVEAMFVQPTKPTVKAVEMGTAEKRVVSEFEAKRVRLQREFEQAREAARLVDEAERLKASVPSTTH
jgi:hypothetical protein